MSLLNEIPNVDPADHSAMCADLVAEIPGLQTQFDIVRYMRRVSACFGFQLFMVYALPINEAEKLSDGSVVSNWPTELLTRYDELGLISSSASIRRLKETTVPFRYTISDWEAEAGHPEGMHELAKAIRAAGVSEYYFIPVHNAAGGRGAVIWSGPRADIPMAEIAELQMISIHVFNRLADIESLGKKNRNNLTEREIECLSWTAAGKTSSDISGIIGLSEHTVNHYLNQATRKLDAVNRTQAVVIAMKKGYIA